MTSIPTVTSNIPVTISTAEITITVTTKLTIMKIITLEISGETIKVFVQRKFDFLSHSWLLSVILVGSALTLVPNCSVRLSLTDFYLIVRLALPNSSVRQKKFRLGSPPLDLFHI